MKFIFAFLLFALFCCSTFAAPKKMNVKCVDESMNSDDKHADHSAADHRPSVFGGPLARFITGALLVTSSLSGAMANNNITDGFRPTTPGHAPGFGNRRLMTAPNPPTQIGQSAEEKDKNGFRPTTPGHSPGVGNRRLMTTAQYPPSQFGQNAEAKDKSDFPPTTPRHSPAAAGH